MLKNLKNALKRLILQIQSYLPTRLPVGMTAYEEWLTSITDLAGPIADKMSMEWVIDNEVMVIKSGQDRIPKRHFIKRLRKFAANQLAAAHVNRLKDQQKAAEEAAKAAVTAEQGSANEKN